MGRWLIAVPSYSGVAPSLSVSTWASRGTNVRCDADEMAEEMGITEDKPGNPDLAIGAWLRWTDGRYDHAVATVMQNRRWERHGI